MCNQSIQTLIMTAVLAWAGYAPPSAHAQASDSLMTAQPRVILPGGNRETVSVDTVRVSVEPAAATADTLPTLLTAPGGVLNDGLLSHDRDTLRQYYREQGFWQASVDAVIDSLDSGVTVRFIVEAGSPVYIGRIDAGGPTVTLPWQSVISQTESGAKFTVTALQDAADAITGAAEFDGYPDVTITPALTARVDTIDVHLHIIPGSQATVDSLAVDGLEHTRRETVLREFGALIGRPASRETIREAGIIAGRIEFVTIADEPRMRYFPGEPPTLMLTFTEGPQGSFDGVLGYQPESGTGDGEVVGRIDLAFPNLLGTGRSAAIRWENLGADTEDLELRYREPWAFGLPLALEGALLQQERDRLGYTKTGIEARAIRQFGQIEATIGYRYEKTSADSLTSARAHGIDLGGAWIALDNRQNPRSGFRYRASWTLLDKRYRFGLLDSHSLERTEFDMDHFIPTLARQAIAVMLRYRRIVAPEGELAPADRYWLGGTRSIRGYREQLFPAVEAVWTNIEYRVLQTGQSRLFVFYDYGYLVNLESDDTGASGRSAIHRSGYGFGLRIGSRAGTLGFDYGLGEGDSPGEGKLHVSLFNYF